MVGMSISTIILGVDIGTTPKNPTALVALSQDGDAILWHHVIVPDGRATIEQRIAFIAREVREALLGQSIAAVGVEAPHIRRNMQTALTLGMAVGAVLAATSAHAPTFLVQPAEARSAIGADGAGKESIMRAALLQFPDIETVVKKSHRQHVADAVAVALAARGKWKADAWGCRA